MSDQPEPAVDESAEPTRRLPVEARWLEPRDAVVEQRAPEWVLPSAPNVDPSLPQGTGFTADPPHPHDPHPHPAQLDPTRPALSDSDQRLWSVLAHASVPVTGFVGPLVIRHVFRSRSGMLAGNGLEALNFGILFTIAELVSAVLTRVYLGEVLVPVIWLISVVFAVLGGVSANRGEVYRYPFALRLVSDR